MRQPFTLTLRSGKQILLGQRTAIVGVLNVTPDSFSDGGKNFDAERAIERALEMESEGADIIEVGGESTRPGSDRISAEEELSRIAPVLAGLSGRLQSPISIDTYKSAVAERAIEMGAEIVNDISALRFDPLISDVAARREAILILMHMRGEPATMQQTEPSRDIFADIEQDFRLAIEKAEIRGVCRERIILDPGIGFGKTLEQNLALLNQLDRLSEFDLPLMIGTSRKSFIGKITGRPTDERIFGTAASVSAAILRGAHIVRVHDVKEMREVALIADAILNSTPRRDTKKAPRRRAKKIP
ncbi:MAG: dihydropteroate synthase [Acidobacteriota bacterium]